jgi:hypothetical protein
MATGRVTKVRTAAGKLAASGGSIGSGIATLKAVQSASGSSSGTGTALLQWANATGTATGAGVAALQVVLSSPGTSAGSGTATATPTMGLSATGTAASTGTTGLLPTMTLTTAGSSQGDGGVSSALTLTATGASAGTGTAAYLAQLTGTSSGDGTVTIIAISTVSATGTSQGDGHATLRKTVDQTYWRDLHPIATVYESAWTAATHESPWHAILEETVRLSTGTSGFVVVHITNANFPIDMPPPLIGLGVNGNYPTTWGQGAWVQPSPGNLTETDTSGNVVYYRDARVLIGPYDDHNAAVYTTPGDFTVFYDLTDTPEHIIEAAGRVRVTGPLYAGALA